MFAPLHAQEVGTFHQSGQEDYRTAPALDLGLSDADGVTVSVADPAAIDPHSIEVRVDSTHVHPVLAAGLASSDRFVVAGERAEFATYANYPAFIERGQIRVFKLGDSPATDPIAVVDVGADGTAEWPVEEAFGRDLFFVYRAYGSDGRFDETAPQEMTIVDKRTLDDVTPPRPLRGTIDQALIRTISLKDAATVTVTGGALAEGEDALVGGHKALVKPDGAFVSEQILPRSQREITVTIGSGAQRSHVVTRAISPKDRDWFLVGQGDLTVGKSFATGPARLVSGNPVSEGSYAIGRAAFYAKGVVGDDIRITSSIDTDEVLVKDLFSNLDRKDPRSLLRRLDSSQYYPTYGDDSTLVEDAPTQGRFYLRAQKDASQVVIGNFIAQSGGSELAQLDRGVFGLLVDGKSEATTSFGERKLQVLAFASDPGTVPQREEFASTGGSLYYLKRQDISVGSERVFVEIRDRETGYVLESRPLYPRQDYDLDPFSGRLTLLRPLPSRIGSGSVVRESSSPGNVPVLVVRYEYTPLVGAIDGYTLGGRASYWVGETLNLGLTAQSEETAEAAQTLIGADATFRFAAGTYLKAEFAQTDGPGFGQSNSTDGGLSFDDVGSPGIIGKAQAWRTELAVDFAEVTRQKGERGNLSAFYEKRDKGFASIGRLSPTDIERWGVAAEVPLAPGTSLSADYDELAAGDAGRNKTGAIQLVHSSINETGRFTAKAGLRYDDISPGTRFNRDQDGRRTDAAIELGLKPDKAIWELSAFAQATLDNDATRYKNNRFGAGLEVEVNDRLSFAGELSGGSGGLGADLRMNHRLGDGSEAYVGYSVVADRTDNGLEPQNLLSRANRGGFVVGARQRFSDSLSVYGENRITTGHDAPSLTRSFGLEYEPSPNFSVTGSFESGRIDNGDDLYRRTGASLAVGYTTDRIRLGTAIEMRADQRLERDHIAILWRNNVSLALNPDWRLLGEFNLAEADVETPHIRAAEFIDTSLGFAYRPVDNERFNALVRVQYFEDLGPVGQITGSGQIESPKQISTVISTDFNYDLNERLTVGGKYGYRMGKVSLGRDSSEFVSSDAHLLVGRIDYSVVKNWDVLAEGRALWVPSAKDVRTGALGAIYRHINENVKIGAGYSLSDFSDDLTDQSYTSHGPFLNLIGKF